MNKKGLEHHDNLYTMVTPAMAEELLERNTHNRPLRAGVVEKYARDMKAGHWQKNAQPVTVDWNNAIHNGQHRLFAVIEAGISVPLMLLTGLDPATVLTVDTGVARSYADYRKLSENGEPLKNLTMYQAVVRLIQWYETRWPAVSLQSGKEGAATHHELDETAGRYPTISGAIDLVAARNHPLKNIMTPTLLAFVYGLAAQTHPIEAAHWVESIWNPEGLTANNPAASLRARFTSVRVAGHKLPRATAICFIIKSWNAFVRGETLGYYRWAADEPMPAIFGTPQYTGKRGAQAALAAKKKASGTKLGRRLKVKV